jgi:hypothetical protein
VYDRLRQDLNRQAAFVVVAFVEITRVTAHRGTLGATGDLDFVRAGADACRVDVGAWVDGRPRVAVAGGQVETR